MPSMLTSPAVPPPCYSPGCERLPSPDTAEIAGNIVETSWGCGVLTRSGYPYSTDRPLSRIMIHHNQVENTMLGCNDYGALEIFGGGPAYFYNNVAYNAVGSRTFDGKEGARTLYLDGGFKIYSFNNILAGKRKEDAQYYNACGYNMVFGFMDHLFNNTIHRFNSGLHGSSGNRSCILGNILTDCSGGFIDQNRRGDASMLGGGDTGEQGRLGIPTMAYANNIFFGSPRTFGAIGGTSTDGSSSYKVKTIDGKTIEELRLALQNKQARASSVGEHIKTMPLVNPDKRDYRLTNNSAARNKGVKFFAPWGLYGMVGEWNFCKNPAVPTIVLGENFYLTEEFSGRGMYYYPPRNDLKVSQCTVEDYESSPLEDWIEGALKFNGKRFATLTHAEMDPGGTFKGGKRKTLDMSTNSFLVEAYFKVESGHVNGTLAGKSAKAGYNVGIDANGKAVIRLIYDGEPAVVAASSAKVNDGQWHHLITEVDRPSGIVRIYVDGKMSSNTKLTIPVSASLANTADFVVGKGLIGSLDFLRVSRGTLADAKTTIEELYAWQFDGPFLRDFCGNAPVGKRDAGAIEEKE